MSSNHYSLVGRVKGPTKAIHCVKVSKDGSYLASGGWDGLCMWKLPTLERVGCTRQSFLQGPLTCMQWVAESHGTARYTLVCGSALGYVAFWRQPHAGTTFEEKSLTQVGTGAEITCMSITQRESVLRLALATADRLVQVWMVDSHYQMTSVFCTELMTTVPKSISLVDNTARDVRVFGLKDGKLIILRGDTGAVQVTKDLGIQVGYVAIRGKLALIDNIENGLDLRNVETGEYVHRFEIGDPMIRVPKHVAFGENGQVVVGGSDHGSIYVFDRRSGERRDVLRHAESGLVQTITVHDSDNSTTIIGATSTMLETIDISIWSRKRVDTTRPSAMRRGLRKVGSWLRSVLWFTMFLCTLTLLLQGINQMTPAGWAKGLKTPAQLVQWGIPQSASNPPQRSPGPTREVIYIRYPAPKTSYKTQAPFGKQGRQQESHGEVVAKTVEVDGFEAPRTMRGVDDEVELQSEEESHYGGEGEYVGGEEVDHGDESTYVHQEDDDKDVGENDVEVE